MTTINIRAEVEALLGRNLDAIEAACFRDNRFCGMANPHDLVAAIAANNEAHEAYLQEECDSGVQEAEIAAEGAWLRAAEYDPQAVAEMEREDRNNA